MRKSWMCRVKMLRNGGEKRWKLAHYEPTYVGRLCDTATCIAFVWQCSNIGGWMCVCVSLVAIRMVVVTFVTWLVFQPHTHKRVNEGKLVNTIMPCRWNATFLSTSQSSSYHIHYTTCIQLTPFNLFEHIRNAHSSCSPGPFHAKMLRRAWVYNVLCFMFDSVPLSPSPSPYLSVLRHRIKIMFNF